MKVKLLFFQVGVFILLFFGYVGVYVCRANVTVVTQFLINKYPNVTPENFGWILTIGTLSYAVGKLVSGFILDASGNRANWVFIISLFGTIVTTVVFGFAKSLTGFGFSWVVNRFCQSFGWGAMMVMVSHWYGYQYHSRLIGMLSLSFLFGDAFARLYLGGFIYLKFHWSTVIFISAGTLTVFWIPSVFFLYSDPTVVGEDQVESNPDCVVKEKEESLLSGLARNPGFYLLCIIAAGFTFIRENLRDWVHVFLVQKAGISADVAPIYSCIFPLAGGIGSLATGFMMDLFPRGKGLIMGLELICLLIVLIVLTICNYLMDQINIVLAMIFISMIGFTLTGPYALLQVFALDLGGKRGTASISSLFDTVGYIFGSASGIATGYISQRFGWTGVFILLSVISLISSGVCILFFFISELKKKQVSGKSKEEIVESVENENLNEKMALIQ